MREDLALRGMSAGTLVTDVGCARRFAEDFGRSMGGTPCIDPVLDGGSFVTEAFSRGRSVSA
jgi:hypothetical protein